MVPALQPFAMQDGQLDKCKQAGQTDITDYIGLVVINGSKYS